MTTLVRRLGPRHPFLYGVTLILAICIGATMAYAQKFLGENGLYIVVGALLAGTVAAAILLQWRLGILLLPAILPFENVVQSVSGHGGTKAITLLTFVSFALALLRNRELFERFLRLWRHPLMLALFVFMLWILASTLWASEQGRALTKASTFLGLLGVTVVVGMLEKRYLARLWAIVALSAALSVPAAYILPQSGKMVEAGRFGTGGADPNNYACLLVIMFFVAYFGLRHYKLAPYILTPILFYGIFATQSRTALIALVVAPLATVFVPRLAVRLGWRTMLLYGLGAAVLAGITLAIPSIAQDILERYSTLSQYQAESTWAGRWDIWRAAFYIIATHPFLGVGAGNFAYTAIDYSSVVAGHSADKGEIMGVAHNIFLGIASELGLVGLTLFLGILFFAFRTALMVSQRSALGIGILLGLIVFTIAGMTLTWEYKEVGYVLFGSVLSLQLSLQRPTRHEPSLVKRGDHRW